MILKNQKNNNMKKIIGVYKITNTVTKDFYIGSSKNIKNRWIEHKCPSTWKRHPNNPLYQDMKKYGTDKFKMQILEEVDIDSLKEKEQQFIELFKPTYNQINAKGWDVEKWKKYMKEYQKSEKYQESHRKANNRYYNQLCCYNGEELTLRALALRFRKAGVEHPTIEAKKYILKKNQKML